MKLDLDYGRHGLQVEVPDHARVLRMAGAPGLDRVEERLQEVLLRPLGKPSLGTLAAGCRNPCIVIADITRPVPNATILPPILKVLDEAGIPREQVTILVGTGLHRPNEGDELVALVGPEIARDYRIVNHKARDRETLVHLGETSCGAPIWIDRIYVEADLKIATSLIEPHLMAGFSGGRKAICPGLMGVDTMRVLHGPELIGHPRSAEGIIAGNPFHRQALEVARRAGVDFSLNVAMNDQRRITGIFCGDLEEAHAAGVRFVEEQNGVFVDEPADMVLTTAAGYPLDLTFYQAVKGLTAVLPAVRKGGVIVLAAQCQEGVGSPEFTELLLQTSSVSDFREKLDDPGFFTIDQWQLQELCKVLDKARVMLFAEGIPALCHGRLLVDQVDSVEQGLELALGRCGPAARLAVVPKGPYVLIRKR